MSKPMRAAAKQGEANTTAQLQNFTQAGVKRCIANLKFNFAHVTLNFDLIARKWGYQLAVRRGCFQQIFAIFF